MKQRPKDQAQLCFVDRHRSQFFQGVETAIGDFFPVWFRYATDNMAPEKNHMAKGKAEGEYAYLFGNFNRQPCFFQNLTFT